MRADAALFKLNGDLTWQITEPRLSFKMDGGLQNISPVGTSSGTVKLVLWATKTPYPSVGYIVGEFTLGQIGGGYQFSNFTVKSPSNVPTVTGDYYFTIAVLEYTTAGWVNRLLVDTGTSNLLAGNFSTQLKWTTPTAKVIAPPATLTTGKRLKLTLKGSEFLNLFPTDYQKVTTISVNTATKATVNYASTQSTAAYTYKIKDAKLNGKSCQAGSLYLDYSNSSSYATITLYFQSATSGTYKSVEKTYRALNAPMDETTWGTFTYQ